MCIYLSGIERTPQGTPPLLPAITSAFVPVVLPSTSYSHSKPKLFEISISLFVTFLESTGAILIIPPQPNFPLDSSGTPACFAKPTSTTIASVGSSANAAVLAPSSLVSS